MTAPGPNFTITVMNANRLEELARSLEDGLVDLERRTHETNRVLPDLNADAADLVHAARSASPYVQERALRLQQLLLLISQKAERPRPDFAGLFRQLERIVEDPRRQRTPPLGPRKPAHGAVRSTAHETAMAGYPACALEGVRFVCTAPPVRRLRGIPTDRRVRFRDEELQCFPEPGTAFLNGSGMRVTDLWVLARSRTADPEGPSYLGLRLDQEMGALEGVDPSRIQPVGRPHRLVTGTLRYRRDIYYVLDP